MTNIDLVADHNLNRVGRITAEIADKIRDEDPRQLYDELVSLCAHHPAKAAQVIMTFAAWFDPGIDDETLIARARSVTAPRIVPVLQKRHVA